MNKTIFFSNRLDDSPESGKDSKNNDTQTASQTTANGQAEKESRWTRKRIGLFVVLALTGIATMLTTSLIEQAGAWFTIDEDGNVRSGPTPPAPVQPVAVPLPVVVVAKPVLKKGAIKAGTWLVAVALEWGIHELMDKFAKIEDEKATATVHGARWLSNEYVHKAESPPGQHQRKYHNYTTTADTGDENDLASAFGWLGYPAMSLTQDQVWGMMYRIKGEIIEEMWVLNDPTYYNTSTREYGYVLPGHIVRARKDSFESEKARKLRQWREVLSLPGLVYETLELRDTYKFNVGSFGMFSDFDDPTPILKVLGTANAIDSEANYYEAKATWRYRELLPNGTFGEWEDDEKTFSIETGDGIKSWEDHHFSFGFCKDNQEITDPAIYEGIERFLSTRDVFEKRNKYVGSVRRGGRRIPQYKEVEVKVGEEPVVVQQYQDLTDN